MYQTLFHFISSKEYGIEGEFDGLILLKANYTGNPVVYAPMDESFNATRLYVTNWTQINNATGVIKGSNLTHGETLWYGPYTFLQPGKYNLHFEVKVSNISASNRFVLRFSYMLNPNLGIPIHLNLINVTGNDLTVANQWTNISLNITAPNFLEYVEFAGTRFDWNGTFAIKEIRVDQVSPL